MRERAVHIFAGPSLFGTGIDTEADSGIQWKPPVRRGDIEALVAEEREPGVIGLADGTFHAYPSVSHIELREAMEAGWVIYGLCSMGAIRVSEMRHMGMKPWGDVAGMFCDNANFADDEVALVHSAEAPYAPLSEPMVHLRAFVAHAIDQGWLNQAQGDRVIAVLRERWYGERTLANLRQAICQALDVKVLPEAIADAVNLFKPYRVKQADLLSFLASTPWTCEMRA
jgi:hypothetical protein